MNNIQTPEQPMHLLSNPYINNNQNNINTFKAIQNNKTNPSGSMTASSTKKDLIKGALIGATATFLLTNKDAQRVIFKNFAKISSLLEMGIEEMKERYEDAKAEVAE